MVAPSAHVLCPDKDFQTLFVHRITPGECAKRQASGYHKCPTCRRFLDLQAVKAPRLAPATAAGASR